MKNKKIIGASAILITLGLLGTTGMGTVFASTIGTNTTTNNLERPAKVDLTDVTRNVTNIDNGVQITMTSTSADIVTKLQSFKEPTNAPKNSDSKITVTHTKIDNGVQTTITSTDATMVSKIQADALENKGPGFGGGHGGRGFEMDSNVTRTVNNIDNGVQINMTSTDAATINRLQSFKTPTDAPKDSNITINQTKIDNGVQLTITSSDSATVSQIQTDAKDNKGFGFGGKHGDRNNQEFDQNVTRTVTKLDNGIQMTMTSTDTATVTKLQSNQHTPKAADSKVIVTQTNLDNGIQVTMTSTDAATVTKLQQGPQHGARHQESTTTTNTNNAK